MAGSLITVEWGFPSRSRTVGAISKLICKGFVKINPPMDESSSCFILAI